MPLFLLIGAAQIFFIIHAVRTGRPYYWITIILFIPLVGIAAYVIVELLPNAHRSPTAQKTMRKAEKLVNPEGDYRKLTIQLENTPTVANKRVLADECVRLGKLDEAEHLYRDGMTGIHATDPALMLGIARVRFAQGDAAGALAALDELQEANPGFRSGDAHMIYARALEDLSRDAEALSEYEALSHYFSGEEPKIRRALLLRKMGDAQAAQQAFADIKRSVERAPSFYRRNQREWYQLAKQNLKA